MSYNKDSQDFSRNNNDQQDSRKQKTKENSGKKRTTSKKRRLLKKIIKMKSHGLEIIKITIHLKWISRDSKFSQKDSKPIQKDETIKVKQKRCVLQRNVS